MSAVVETKQIRSIFKSIKSQFKEEMS